LKGKCYGKNMLMQVLCWDILSDKLKSRWHPAFAVVLEGRILRDDGQDYGSI